LEQGYGTVVRETPGTPERCPQCGTRVEGSPLVCVECGARLNLAYGKTPSPLLPAAIVGVVVLAAGVGLGIALGNISDESNTASKSAAPVASAPGTTERPKAQTQPAAPAATTPAAPAPAPGGLDRSKIEVSVLSGVGAPGIAKRTGTRVEGKGFQLGAVTNSAAPAPHSLVLYAPGKRREARDVGKALGIDRIQPLDLENERISKGAAVVVVVGGDRRGAPAADRA
jgi:LytR cell envelope-related transcriptional attenuator